MKNVVDASTLISLAKIGFLDLLIALKIDCILPEAVFEEAVLKGEEKGVTDAVIIKSFIREHSTNVVAIKSSHGASVRKKLNKTLAKGDEAVLAVAMKEKAGTILTDDDGLGRIALALGFTVKAAPDLLLEGLEQGILDIIRFESLIRGLVIENRLGSPVAELYVMEGKKNVKNQGTDKNKRTSR